MKNILIIIPSLKFGGGAEKVASTVGSELFKSGYNVSYFTFYNAENKYSFLGEEYCLNEKKYDNIFVKIIKLFIRAVKISRYCKKNYINSIISHMEDANFSAIISKIFGNKTKINIMIHHSVSSYGNLYKKLIKLLYKFADNVVVLTNYEKENLFNNFGIKSEKIQVIPNAIDIEKINKLKDENLGEYSNLFDNNNFKFITIGRLTKIKNQGVMIDSFNKFNKKYPNSQLFILGDGELKDELKLHANENVFFLGNQSNVYKFLGKCDCFLLTSISEAFSISILEAMACGLPVISTETQGPNEILDNGKYGIITKNNDEDDFYSAIEHIVLDKKFRTNISLNCCEGIKKYLREIILKKRKNILS